MNKKNVSQIFDRYVEKFDFLNDEYARWMAVKNFKEVFDLDAKDFTEVLKKAYEAAGGLVDQYMKPFAGLVLLAEKFDEAETIRDMFKELYQEDGGDLINRQNKVERFISICNVMVEEYYPDSDLYKNDQYSVMAYLWLYDPEHNYWNRLCDTRYFANAAEVHDNWGDYSEFDMDVYYAFCNKIVEEMKNSKELETLIETICTIYGGNDVALRHILLSDIISKALPHNLYEGIKIKKFPADERKAFESNRKLALEMQEELGEMELKNVMLKDGLQEAVTLLESGATIRHKIFGEAKLETIDNDHIVLRFVKKDMEKKFQITSAIGGGFIKIDDPRFDDFMEKYGPAFKGAASISNRIFSVRQSMEKYNDFVE